MTGRGKGGKGLGKGGAKRHRTQWERIHHYGVLFAHTGTFYTPT